MFKYSEINTIDSSKLEEIGLTSGALNNETIQFIHKFNFKYLQKLYLHSNGLSSLSFIKDLELPNIKEIMINNNELEEYYPLSKYKTLNKIIIRKNRIKNIDNLISFIDEFPDLKEIDLKDNEIDLNDNENEKIISKVKTKLNITINFL